jgi:hypothetical protein
MTRGPRDCSSRSIEFSPLFGRACSAPSLALRIRRTRTRGIVAVRACVSSGGGAGPGQARPHPSSSLLGFLRLPESKDSRQVREKHTQEFKLEAAKTRWCG